MRCGEFERHLGLLSRALLVREFSFSQFNDIFTGLSEAVQNIVNDFYINVHQDNLSEVLKHTRPEELPARYRGTEINDVPDESFADRVFEIFVRDRIAAGPVLQVLDRYLKAIRDTLDRESRKLSADSLGALLNYDPEKAVSSIESAGKDVADLIHLGNKAFNLVRIGSRGFPVPPGFVITTEVYRCRELFSQYPPAEEDLRKKIDKQIARLQEVSGLKFGDSKAPLLLSVRSGAAISQPGMMDTVLNVGINEEIVAGMAAGSGNPWFAWDCFRRFLQSCGMAFGIPRDLFDELIRERKEKAGAPRKSDLSPDQMESLAKSYSDLLRRRGVEVIEDPWAQLRVIIQKVFDSWNSSKASAYRQILGLSDDWGTAVTVQQMVFGNRSPKSGAGVVFTHSPRWPSHEIRLWGDYTRGNQGEDVVSGLVSTLPITGKQAELEGRQGQTPLEKAFPEIHKALVHWIEELINGLHFGPQEIEFTFEGERGEDLHILQTRDMGLRKREKVPVFVAAHEAGERLIGRGVGGGGGAITGRAVYNLDEIRAWREKEPGTSLILIRGDTVPDDIREIHASDGILTARGGTTSHAAIVAHRLGKTCVVGMNELFCDEKAGSCTIGRSFLKSGDWLSMDGREGTVYYGKMEIP
jgi:pyruvate,orthophosphate dikinase